MVCGRHWRNKTSTETCFNPYPFAHFVAHCECPVPPLSPPGPGLGLLLHDAISWASLLPLSCHCSSVTHSLTYLHSNPCPAQLQPRAPWEHLPQSLSFLSSHLPYPLASGSQNPANFLPSCYQSLLSNPSLLRISDRNVKCSHSQGYLYLYLYFNTGLTQKQDRVEFQTSASRQGVLFGAWHLSRCRQIGFLPG